MTTNHTNSFEISNRDLLPKDPLVSVFMVTYNHEQYIRDAVEGVVSQQCLFPIELVIGEDVSTDRTGTIVQDYQKRYPGLIRIITADRNVGRLANSARCIAECRGKYIAYCEGDDYWDDAEKLNLQLGILESNPDIMLTCHAVRRVDAISGRVTDIAASASKSRLLTTKEIILGDGDFIPTCSILVRQSVLGNKPDWWVNSPVGDYPLVLRASQLGRVAYQNRVMGSYRINVPGSWTVNHREKSTLNEQYAHALKIKAIMHGFDKDNSGQYSRPTRFIIRRYLYNAIVKSDATSLAKLALAKQESRELNWLDQFLIRLAIITGRKYTRLREYPFHISRLFMNFVNNLLQPSV